MSCTYRPPFFLKLRSAPQDNSHYFSYIVIPLVCLDVDEHRKHIRHLIETCDNRRNFLDMEEWRKLSRYQVDCGPNVVQRSTFNGLVRPLA